MSIYANRVQVSVEQAYNDLDPDTDFYYFSKEADEMNLDPWTLVEIDKLTKGEDYILSWANGTRDRIVKPTDVVFVNRNALKEA